MVSTTTLVAISTAAGPFPESLQELPTPSWLSDGLWYTSGLFLKLIGLPVFQLSSCFISVLGKSVNISLKFSSLLALTGILVAFIWTIVRYRYLTVYSRLPSEPHRQEPKLGDIFVPKEKSKDKSGYTNYLDQFLSAIKVFGYLDRSVFQELTKRVKTCKLSAGEIAPLREDKGFSIVIEGSVSVFIKLGTLGTNNYNTNEGYSDESSILDVDGVKYQLLTEIQDGAPLSSLFTILSLFTEDIKNKTPPSDNSLSSYDAFYSDESRKSYFNQGAASRSNGYFFEDKANYSQILIKANTETTIAVIPAKAFRRLTREYPESVSQIIQIILTRFQRVTFQTAHSYLGLTYEILQTEVALNEKDSHKLPPYLKTFALHLLDQETRESCTSNSGGISLIHKALRKRRDSIYSNINRKRSRQVILQPKLNHPGDLLSNVPLSRYVDKGVSTQPSPLIHRTSSTANYFAGDDETEEAALRTAVIECMFKFLGLDKDNTTAGNFSTMKTENNEISREVSPNNDLSESSRNTSLESLSHHSHRHSKINTSQLNILRNPDSKPQATKTLPDGAGFETIAQVQDAVINQLDVIFYKKDSALVNQNEICPGLFYVIDGVLGVGHTAGNGVYKQLYLIKPGGIGGYIGSVLGYKSFVDVKAKTDVYVGFLPRSSFEHMAEKYPLIYLNIAKSLTNILPNFIYYLDFALEWVQASAGETIYNQGDDSEAIYIILNGRAREIVSTPGLSSGERKNSRTVGEYGQGESIGELEVLTLDQRPSSLHAIRDTELARIPKSFLDSLALQYPAISIHITSLVATRMKKLIEERHNVFPSTNSRNTRNDLFVTKSMNSDSFKTITVLPVNTGTPVAEFGSKLLNAFLNIGRKATAIDQVTILTHLGRHAFTNMGKLKLAGYLADLEERYQTVIFIADTAVNSLWTQRCISQADCILLVCDVLNSPDIGDYERLVIGMKTTTRTELVLVHSERYIQPGLTNLWLKNRVWVHSHHHMQMQLHSFDNEDHVKLSPMASVLSDRLALIKSKMQKLQLGLLSRYKLRRGTIYTAHNQSYKNDFNRLARILSGQAVGLVLGGGGARGIAHIGVIKALEEFGIPIDIIGGTSIGSFIGGLYARDYDLVQIYGRAKRFSGRMASLWRMVFDLTYPATSYTTGHEFNRGIWKSFGDSRIEDFWLKYYNNTTNITHSRMEIHTSGYAWRYIRASMSLAGLLPPMVDNDGSMLLDGGYIDNLTVEEMQSQGASVIIAVDVGSIDDTTPMSYGDSLSGLWVLFNRWNFFSKQPNIPSLAEIQARLAYVSSVGALNRAKNSPGVFYLRPPIDDYATLDFGKFEEICEVGARYSNSTLQALVKTGTLQIPGANITKAGMRVKTLTRRNSI